MSTAVSKPLPLPDQLTDTQLADEYGEVKALADQFKPTEDRRKALAAEIQERFKSKAGDQAFILKGKTWEVQVGMRENERKLVSIVKLWKASRLKISEFLEHCSITLKNADPLVPEAKKDELFETDRTGSRPLKAVFLVKQ